MSKNIRISKKVLLESQIKELKEKYSSKPIFEPVTYDDYEHLPRYIFAKAKMKYVPGFHKVFRKNERRINENIIKYPKSQPFNKVKKHILIDVFRGDTNVKIEHASKDMLDTNGVYGHICITMRIGRIFNGMPEHLIELMHTLGYYLAYKTPLLENNKHYYMWQFEPYYYLKVRETLEDYIFHVTKIILLNNIKKYGILLHKKEDDILSYPSRCYFFNVPYRNNFIAYAQAGKKIDENGNFGVCKIDTSLLSSDVDFFTDSNYIEKNGIYTYSDIPANAIIDFIEDSIN